jgi:protein ImuB
VERQLVVWCPGLLEQQEHGREARAFDCVLATVEQFSPRVDVLRPGVCAVPTRGPSRYFGGDETLAHLVAWHLASVDGVEDGTGLTARGVVVGIGVADGLFAASLAARSSLRDPSRAPLLVAPGGTPDFLSPWSVGILDRPELADLLCRLGIRTLGAFADLPARHVLARFGVDGATCQAVAAGAEGELPSLHFPSPRSARRWSPTAGTAPATPGSPERQAGFFGGAAGAEARAAEAVRAVQRLLDAEAVVRGRLQGGRGPAERARLVPWGEQGAGTGEAILWGETFPRKRSGTKGAGEGTHRRQTFPRKRSGTKGAGEGTHRRQTFPGAPREATPRGRTSQVTNSPPWPGQVPAPSPVVVFRGALPAELFDAFGHPVGVTGGGIASAAPARLSVAGGPWSEVSGWAGPWPSDERWWSKRGRNRQARMQVVTAGSTAYLLACRRGWWVEGIYD